MKAQLYSLSTKIASIDKRYVQLVFALIALTLTVVGAAAPEIGGDIGGHPR